MPKKKNKNFHETFVLDKEEMKVLEQELDLKQINAYTFRDPSTGKIFKIGKSGTEYDY
jgi:hypothetical protein